VPSPRTGMSPAPPSRSLHSPCTGPCCTTPSRQGASPSTSS
jgi:hypothetical protein